MSIIMQRMSFSIRSLYQKKKNNHNSTIILFNSIIYNTYNNNLHSLYPYSLRSSLSIRHKTSGPFKRTIKTEFTNSILSSRPLALNQTHSHNENSDCCSDIKPNTQDRTTPPPTERSTTSPLNELVPSITGTNYQIGILPVSASSSKFVQGYKAFRELHYVESTDLYEKLKLGQSPRTLVITCSDSRVDPALITASEPGEMFVVRYVGNVVPHPVHPASLATYAALDYAVNHLKVKNILILGHSSCGGIGALMDAPNTTEEEAIAAATPGQISSDNAINLWMGMANPAKQLVLSKQSHTACAHTLENISVPHNMEASKYFRNVCAEQMNVILGLDNLLQYSNVAEKVSSGELVLHGWWNDLQGGQMFAYDGKQGAFIRL